MTVTVPLWLVAGVAGLAVGVVLTVLFLARVGTKANAMRSPSPTHIRGMDAGSNR